MTYLGELRRNARPLAAASLGSGAGLMLMSYTSTIFGPYLLKEFAWSRAQFALIGLSMFSTLLALPLIGRLADRFGVRRAAVVGALGLPACLFAYSFMTGSFTVYFAISCLILALGSFTSPVVYTRLIAADFDKARGLALTIVTIAPALMGAIAAPLLIAAIEAWGWRAGYRCLGAVVLLLGLAAVALTPPADPAARQAPKARHAASRGELRRIFASKPFWVIFAAMLLCMLPTPLYSSQMALMLSDNHLRGQQVAVMISVYGIGTIVGRVVCGLALDRFSAPLVAALSMLPPAIGYAVLALPYDAALTIGLAMFMVGASVGAEGDLQSFLVARHFSLRIFSTTLSFVYCSVFAASAIGAGLLSLSLKTSDSFAPFLAAMAVAVAAGGALFLLLPWSDRFALVGDEAEDAATLPDRRAQPLEAS